MVYQIRLLAPRGPDDILTRELVALTKDIFGRHDSTITVSTKPARKHDDHTLTYINIHHKTQKGQ